MYNVITCATLGIPGWNANERAVALTRRLVITNKQMSMIGAVALGEVHIWNFESQNVNMCHSKKVNRKLYIPVDMF